MKNQLLSFVMGAAICLGSPVAAIHANAPDQESLTLFSKPKSPCPKKEPIVEEAPCVPAPKIHSIYIGGSYSYVWLSTGIPDTFTGSLGGAQAMYEYKPLRGVYEGIKGSWRQGSTSNGADTRYLIDARAEERVGYTFARNDNRYFGTLFTGFGYRYISNKLEQPRLSTLFFYYNEFYVPVGVLTAGVWGNWSVGLNAVWMPQVFPTVDIVPIGNAYWTLARMLKNFQVELPIRYTTAKYPNFFLELKPFFEFWEDGRTLAVSAVGTTLGIPKNTYRFAGAELNFGGKF